MVHDLVLSLLVPMGTLRKPHSCAYKTFVMSFFLSSKSPLNACFIHFYEFRSCL